ncbi:hypothetical protein [Streptomyces ardesiacus]|uniref:hypothetical protein n=1 Tax=Streptomyces ardesiacus TaxID=285564 RepID=UPI00201E955F|nr:hypothetical protein [Streptomyces ardesiacus]MCL7369588.1 hypothetical protein [Streptomyces ardesiacus]
MGEIRQVRITGEIPNIRILLDELESDPQFTDSCKTEINRLEQHRDQLGSSFLATLVIDISVGLAGNALYDLIKHGVSAARRRGNVTTQGLDTSADPTTGIGEGSPAS